MVGIDPEVFDDARNAVVEDAEVFAGEIGHGGTVSIDDGAGDRNEFDS